MKNLVLTVFALIVFTACSGNDNTPVEASGSQANELAEIFYPDIYLFHESVDMGIYFAIHPAWLSLYGTTEIKAEHDLGNTQTLVVYHIATREEFGMGESGGVLFSISRSPSALFAEVSEGFDGVILAQRWGYVYTLNYPRGFQYLYGRESEAAIQYLNMMSYLEPWNDNFVTNSFRLVGEDPFAEALLEFFEGGVEAPVGVDATKAFWHTIGDIIIMVAIRHEVRVEETGHDQPIPVARVFYWIDGVLNYKDIETFQDRPTLTILTDGIALFGGSWGNQWTTLLGIENGSLTRTLTLFYMLDADDISGENPRYYIRHGEWRWQDGFENLTPITQEEFYDILNTSEFTRWEDVFDLTERILSGEMLGFTTGYQPLQLSIYLTPENAVAIGANMPLRDVAWVQLDHDFVDEEFIFIPSDEHIGAIAELLPGALFAKADFIDNGIMPTNAITFIDPYGERRYFAFQQDNSFGLDPAPHLSDFLDNVVDGLVRIYATRGDGSRTDLGYFNVDASNFDSDTWLAENNYRWAAHVMRIWELENIR